MCTLCNLTQTFDPARHTGSAAAESGVNAPVFETQFSADVFGDSTTTATMTVGDTFYGTLGASGSTGTGTTSDDTDWVAVTLEAGVVYTVKMDGGSLADPFLRLHDQTGALLDFDDDSGAGLNARLNFKAPETGTYFIAATSLPDGATGTYELEVFLRPPSPIGTLDELADYLVNGFWGGAGAGFFTNTNSQITVNITALTAAGQQLARWAFDAWEMVANIEFIETAGAALITFDDNQSGAFASSQLSGGFLSSSQVNVSTNWLAVYGTTIESYSFATYVHEVGHALGLGHQGDYNGAATYGVDESFANDSWQLSVMSYFDQAENTTITADRAGLVTAMLADIVAIQNMYGLPGASSATAGDTVYGRGSTLGTYLDEVFGELAGDSDSAHFNALVPVAFTIYDRDGADTINASHSTTDDQWDLRPERYSNVGGLVGNVGIARGTMIENLITGSGDDDLTGQSQNNLLNGSGGNDTLRGLGGHDTLIGGLGADDLIGGEGTDTADYATSNGAVVMAVGGGISGGHATGDTLVEMEVVRGGAFSDTLRNNTGLITELHGNGGNDTLVGGSGNETILGGAGSDVLVGGGGADMVDGGDNSDTYLVRAGTRAQDSGTVGYDKAQITNAGGEVLDISDWAGVERVNGNTGDDSIDGAGSAESFVLDGGGGGDTLVGGDAADVLLGGAGDDRLVGHGGNDVMLGDAGNDTFVGGAGNDVFFIGESGDMVSDAGSGADKAVIYNPAGLAISIGTWLGLERINGFTGADAIDATGATAAITFAGLSGDDTLTGGGGDDIFYAGAGADMVQGGAGNDALIGGAGADVLNGGADDDFLLGGADADRFVFANDFGRDIIRDYVDETDLIDFSEHSGVSGTADLVINQNGSDTVMTLAAGGADRVILAGVSAASLEASDFLF